MPQALARFWQRTHSVCHWVLTHPRTRSLLTFVLGGEVPDGVRAAHATSRLLLINSFLILVFALIGAALPQPSPGWAFREGYPLTWISCFQLAGIGYFLGLLWQQRKPGMEFTWKDPSSLWRILSWTFYFLAIDEILKVHEHLDRSIHKIFKIKETTFTDHLDDVIVIFYGMVVVAIMLRQFKELGRFRAALRYFIPAALVAGVSLALDPICSDKPLLRTWFVTSERVEHAILWLDVAEETAKVLAESLILGAVLACREIVQELKSNPPKAM
jgi:hypothetical protein